MTRAVIDAMPAGPDKAEVMAFHNFLTHHAPSKPCDCGVGAKLVDDQIVAQENADCDCPCHVDGWVNGNRKRET